MSYSLDAIIDRFEACANKPRGRRFRRVLDDLQDLADTGSPEAAQMLADALATPGPHYDPEAAYKWYYIGLSQQAYAVNWEDQNNAPPHYCGPPGDFRNESMVSELVIALGWDQVRQLDRTAAQWMADRNLTTDCS